MTTDQTFQAEVRNGWTSGGGSLTVTNNGSGTLSFGQVITSFPPSAPLTWQVNFTGSGRTVVGGGVTERTNQTTTSIEKTGSGTLQILSGFATAPAGSNGGWYVGTTTINGGTLQLGDKNALGGSTASITFGGGTLRYSGSNSVDYSGRIRSSTAAIAIDTAGESVTFGTALPSTNVGGLTKLGTGSLALNAANLYSGTTTISDGTLALGANGSFANSTSISVAAGATLGLTSKTSGFSFGSTQTLGGSGSVALPTSGTVSLEGFLAPGGGSAGTLAFTNAGTFSIESAITAGTGRLQFGLGTVSDLVTVASGTLAIGTGQLEFNDFDFTQLTGFDQGTYTLFSALSPISGSLGAITTGSIGSFTGTLQQAGNEIQLVVVPEPGTLPLAGLGFAAAAWAFRRRAAVR